MKIFATLSPKCAKPQILTRMFDNGMTGVRLNLSHVSLKDSGPMLEALHEAERICKKKADIIIDTQGPELRIGAKDTTLDFPEGETLVLGCGGIAVPDISLPFLLPGQELLLDDGKIQLFVEKTGQKGSSGEAYVHAAVTRGGSFTGRKSMTLPGAGIYPPALTEADMENIAAASDSGVTGILQSFVRGKDDIKTVRTALDDAGANNIKIYAKVENADGMANLSELIEYSDTVVIARGDLGSSMPLWKLPAAQKHIAKACRKAGRPFIVVTQLLASMEEHAVPTRAELNDIFNSVLDGASGLMVTGETAVGRYPAEVIRYLALTAGEALRETGR